MVGVLLLVVVIAVVSLVGSFVLVFRKLAAEGASLPVEEDWLEQISPIRYRPLERLLDAREYARLEAHPRFNRQMLHAFRMQRVRAFRAYLRSLSLDYGRVCNAVKALMVSAARDRADLAGLLVRQRIAFTLRYMVAQCHLTLHSVGLGTVNVAGLLGALDEMRLELNALLRAAQPSAV